MLDLRESTGPNVLLVLSDASISHAFFNDNHILLGYYFDRENCVD